MAWNEADYSKSACKLEYGSPNGTRQNQNNESHTTDSFMEASPICNLMNVGYLNTYLLINEMET
jgi:hypothetical protein